MRADKSACAAHKSCFFLCHKKRRGKEKREKKILPLLGNDNGTKKSVKLRFSFEKAIFSRSYLRARRAPKRHFFAYIFPKIRIFGARTDVSVRLPCAPFADVFFLFTVFLFALYA
jgi:hypothetical protein